MIMLLQKLLDKPQERWIFGSVVVIAANAGGAWTPIAVSYTHLDVYKRQQFAHSNNKYISR